MQALTEAAPRSGAAAEPGTANMTVVLNPRSTRLEQSSLERVLRILATRWQLEIRHSEDRGHAAELARDAARAGADVVAAFGGDGTANEVANGLAGSDCGLACLPAGRTNSFVRTLGMPTDAVLAAARLAQRPRMRQVPLGLAGQRRFLCVSAIGPLALAAEALGRRKRVAGSAAAAYFAAATLTTAAREFVAGAADFAVITSGSELRAIAGVVQNNAPATWIGSRPLHVCETAGLESGALAGAFLTRSALRDLPSLAARALHGSPGALLSHRHVAALPAAAGRRLSLSSERPFAIEADGEFLGRFETIEYSTDPVALRVLA